jgi:hypothetical protein
VLPWSVLGFVFKLYCKTDDWSFRVDEKHITFFRVLKMEERSKFDDFYLSASCSKIWPFSFVPGQ